MTEITCIVCPKGCRLAVDEDNDCAVSGNSCERGVKYGRQEVLDPRRVLTSTVILEGSALRRCPVRTSKPISKSKLFEVMDVVNSLKIAAPVKIGQVLVADILGTGADLIVTRDVD